MHLLGVVISFLVATTTWGTAPGSHLDKIAPSLWRAMTEAPQGESEVIIALEISPELPDQPFHPQKLSAIAETATAVGDDVTLLQGTVLARFRHIPALACRLPHAAIPYLAEHPKVRSISPNRRVRAFDTEGEALIHVPEVRNLGATGQGVGIAVLDSGVDYNHAELSPGGTDASAKTVTLWDAVDNDADPMDEEGHGTEVASVAAGKTLGVARQGRIVAVRVLDANGQGTGQQILTGLDHVLDSIQQGNPYNIRVVNLSLGGYDDTNWPPGSGTCDQLDEGTFNAFQSLRQAGALVVVAAGNGGCTTGVAWPACLSNALAVGAVYDGNVGGLIFGEGQCSPSGCEDQSSAPDQVTCYSDSGEKLDVWAPGSETLAARKGGGMVSGHGTSLAAPYVAGVGALLAQKFPNRSATNFFYAIRNTGTPVTDPRNNITRNRVDALAAYQGLSGGLVYTKLYYVTGIARWPGFPPAYWYSSLAVFNPSTTRAHIRLTFLSDSTTLSPRTYTLDARSQASWGDVLAGAFGFSQQASGAILVEADQPVRVLARTYSQVQVKQQDGSLAWGTMGQFIEGMEPAQALTPGKTGYLVGLRSDSPFRTNVEFVNLTTSTVQVEVRFYTNNGTFLNSKTLAISGRRRKQATQALLGGQSSAYAEVKVLTQGGQVIGLASVVDGKSTDPTTIPLWVP